MVGGEGGGFKMETHKLGAHTQDDNDTAFKKINKGEQMATEDCLDNPAHNVEKKEQVSLQPPCISDGVAIYQTPTLDLPLDQHDKCVAKQALGYT